MSFAQRVQLGPFFSSGQLLGGAKLYHYAAGTTSLKDIWQDRLKSVTLAQPLVADANGMFNFFAEGLYKLVITAADDTVLYTLDDWQLLDFSDPTFAEGDPITSASTIAVGPEIWAHITGSTAIQQLSGAIPFFWAVFDGAPTLVASSQLLTPMGIDRAMQPGDVAFFLNEGGGVWRVAGHVQQDGLLIATQDARTNSVDVALTVRSTTSGTPAAGIGTAIDLEAETSAEAPSTLARLAAIAINVGAGVVQSTLELLTRIGTGSALVPVYRFQATAPNRALFTHANSVDRTYTLPDASLTVVGTDTVQTLTNKTISSTNNTLSIRSGALVTATGSATGALSGSVHADVTMHDFAFAPSITYNTLTGSYGALYGQVVDDPGTTVARIRIGPPGACASHNYVVRWRYITASDEPVIWVVVDANGVIVGVWAADDPTPGGHPGLAMPGMASRLITAADLEPLVPLQAKAEDAAALIRERGLQMRHQAYRALQLLANDPAPAKWILEHLNYDRDGRLLYQETPKDLRNAL